MYGLLNRKHRRMTSSPAGLLSGICGKGYLAQVGSPRREEGEGGLQGGSGVLAQ